MWLVTEQKIPLKVLFKKVVVCILRSKMSVLVIISEFWNSEQVKKCLVDALYCVSIMYRDTFSVNFYFRYLRQEIPRILYPKG